MKSNMNENWELYISFFFSLNKRKSIKKLENRDKDIKNFGEKKESN